MAHSSWGPGWPNCQSAKINRGFYVDTVWGRVTFPGGVRWEICELVARLVQETSNRGYRFGIVGNPSYGCWGYNCRAIAGSSAPSNHSWGLSVDINAPKNPMTSVLVTDMPGWMPDLWNAYGFRWGGDYINKKDAMHYEFMGSVADATRFTALARQNRLGEAGAPPEPPKPPKKKVEKVYFLVQGDQDKARGEFPQYLVDPCGGKRELRHDGERDFFLNHIAFFGGATSIAGGDMKDPQPHVWGQADVDAIKSVVGNDVDNTLRWYAAAKDSPLHEVIRQIMADSVQEAPDTN
jgi:hypothetical protein